MNKDFHYYATYLAALLAGFSKEETDIIAYAAQFVDDCTKSSKPDSAPDRVTCMTTKEMVEMNAKPSSWSRNDKRAFYEIWQCFHFLPGNEFYTNSYNKDAAKGKSHFTEYDNELFRKMCLPNSIAVKEMIEDVKNYYNTSNYLHMIGLRMHVLADTWSHQNFLGTPKWCINDIDTDNVEIEADGQWKKASLSVTNSDNLSELKFKNTPVMPSYESVSYLGHGRIGSIADYGCLKFRYKAFWNDGVTYIERDNVEIFSKAFHQMYYAMKCIRENTPFNVNYIPVDFESNIKQVLRVRKLDQSEEWIELIRRSYNHSLTKDSYDYMVWINEYNTDSGGNYIKFINAADNHVDFVTKAVNTVRFKHTDEQGTKSNLSCAALLNHESKPYAVVCSNGRMYMRSIDVSTKKITGPLLRVDKVPYLRNTYMDKRQFNVNMITNKFNDFNEIEADQKSEAALKYFTPDNVKYQAEIIAGRYLE